MVLVELYFVEEMLTVSLFVTLLGFASGQTTNVLPCDAIFGPLPINAHVEGCVNPPCQLPQLQDAIISLIFKAPHVVYSMTTLARANLGGLNIDYPLGEHAITCNFLENTYCPIIKDEVLVYTLRFYILQIFPLGTSVNVDFRVVDHNQEPLACIRIPIQITAPAGRSDNATSIV